MLPRFIVRDAFYVLYVSTTTFWVYINGTGRRVCENVHVGSYTPNKLRDLHISSDVFCFVFFFYQPYLCMQVLEKAHDKERS